MKVLSWMSGGMALAVAGGGVAALLVVALLVLNPRVDPVELVEEADRGAEPPAEVRPEVVATQTVAPDEPAPATDAVIDDTPEVVAVIDAADTQEDPAPEPATVTSDEATDQVADEVAPALQDAAETPETATDAPEVAPQPSTDVAAGTETETPADQPIEASAQDGQSQGAVIAALPQSELQANPEPAAEETAADQPVTDQSGTDQTGTDQAAAEATQTTPVPSFDTVRLAPDGEALVAGRARAGSTVEILLDGEPVGTAIAGGDGAFVAFLTLPASDAPRVLTLATSDSGEAQLSAQQVIIAPVAQPESELAVSTAAPDAPPVPDSAPAGTVEISAAATSTPALLLSDGDGIRVLQPATPSDPAAGGLGVALDVISYTNDGDVLLQGRGTAGGTVLIYLDNAPLSKAEINADRIWSIGLPAIAAGVYTLRLDEVDATGKVLSRIETPFKREDRAEVAAIAAAGAVSAQVTSAATEGSAADQGDSQQADAGDAAIRVVTVQPGNTLWAIARENYGEGILFVRLFEANRDRIRNPDLIYPGQIFEIPE
ncbi:MAG: LysM peptidoglycan-binding domain-containing protein [Rhodobacterales bacterium]